jgi:hypothetical protein
MYLHVCYMIKKRQLLISPHEETGKDDKMKEYWTGWQRLLRMDLLRQLIKMAALGMHIPVPPF